MPHVRGRGLTVLALFPITGFLGTGAPFAADLNLAVQLGMEAAVTAGALLARRKRYRAHGACQMSVLVLNGLMIGMVMWPSFQQQVRPVLPTVLHKWYYASAVMHAGLGTTAEILGLYIAAVAGTTVLPDWLRFKDWKRWMRMELALWSIVVLTGVLTYYAWYVAPPHQDGIRSRSNGKKSHTFEEATCLKDFFSRCICW
jgi:uncharacterized membrane protein YozB (DUF420 family)